MVISAGVGGGGAALALLLLWRRRRRGRDVDVRLRKGSFVELLEPILDGDRGASFDGGAREARDDFGDEGAGGVMSAGDDDVILGHYRKGHDSMELGAEDTAGQLGIGIGRAGGHGGAAAEEEAAFCVVTGSPLNAAARALAAAEDGPSDAEMEAREEEALINHKENLQRDHRTLAEARLPKGWLPKSAGAGAGAVGRLMRKKKKGQGDEDLSSLPRVAWLPL
jgi:hypothetical protein